MWMKKAMLYEKRRTNLMAQSNNLEMINFHLVGASMMKEQAEVCSFPVLLLLSSSLAVIPTLFSYFPCRLCASPSKPHLL